MCISWVISTSCLTRSPNPDRLLDSFLPESPGSWALRNFLEIGLPFGKKSQTTKYQDVPKHLTIWVHHWWFTHGFFTPHACFKVAWARARSCWSFSAPTDHGIPTVLPHHSRRHFHSWKELSHRTAQHLSLAEKYDFVIFHGISSWGKLTYHKFQWLSKKLSATQKSQVFRMFCS